MPAKKAKKPKPAAKAQPPPKPLDSERLDMQLARSALKKQGNGAKPNREESAALRRVQKNKEDETRTALLSNIPKVLMEKMTGCNTKTLHNHDRLFGIPLRGDVIDLWKVLPAYHKVLSRRETREAMAADEEGLGGGDSPALEALRWKKVHLADIELKQKTGQLVKVDKVNDLFGACAAAGRRARETLVLEFGAKAGRAFDDFLDEISRQSTELLKHDDEPDEDEEGAADPAADGVVGGPRGRPEAGAPGGGAQNAVDGRQAAVADVAGHARRLPRRAKKKPAGVRRAGNHPSK